MLPPSLLSLLRDPAGLAPLELDGDRLVNRTAGRSYYIADSIPVLLEAAELGALNQKYRKMYDWMSYIYDLGGKIGDVFYRGGVARLRRLLMSKTGVKSGDRCLYTSIGTGADLPYLGELVPLEKIELVGVDLSMGMLRRCSRKVRTRQNNILLVQANAERLPLADQSFDVVFHVGGINFFDHPATAVQEMVRVARPGALIMIADETKAVVEHSYQKNPLSRAYFKGADVSFNPRDWVPAGAVDPVYEEVWDGRGYILTFRAPAAAASAK